MKEKTLKSAGAWTVSSCITFFVESLIFDILPQRLIARRLAGQKGAMRICGSSLAHGQLIVHCSTPRWISPSRADILTVLHNARHSGIVTRKRKHLGAAGAIVLRVILQE
jgi:hypothetical protein